VASLGVLIVPVSGSGLAPNALSTHTGGGRDPLGLRCHLHLVVPGACRRGNHHGQQKPQPVAQALPRPVINYLIQVLGQCAASGANSRDLPTGVPAGVLGVVLGDELLSGSGPDRAG